MGALNINSTLPNFIFENENLDFNLFLDMANVWKWIIIIL